MNILFVHNNFPAQYRGLIPALIKRGDYLVSISQHENGSILGVLNLKYSFSRGNLKGQHSWLITTESAVLRGEAVAIRCQQLKQKGFSPDVILVHSGWGEALFIKDIWPEVKLISFFEYYYRMNKDAIFFDKEFPPPDDVAFQFRMRNALLLSALDSCDIGVTSTQWQHSLFPTTYKNKIAVVHEGIDTTLLKPNIHAWVKQAKLKHTFNYKTPLITYINRNLEPARGYHRFLRALPEIQRRYPDVHVFIIGENGKSYTTTCTDKGGYKKVFLDEVKDQLDMRKIHFLGKIAYNNYIKILQISTVHVYLSYPFFVSWSLLEAMSVGCKIVAARTDPIKEVIEHKRSGLLVDFFSTKELVHQVCNILKEPEKYNKMGKYAREYIITNFDFNSVIFPQQLKLIDE